MENSADLSSNDLQLTQTADVKTGDDAVNGCISQIPGLSPGAISEERSQGRRFRVLDTDSEYIKLAKQGGHKGLLWHEEAITSKPTPYKPLDWFGTASVDVSNPSLINSEENQNPGAFKPRAPPFGNDNMSAWEREISANNERERNNNVDDSQMRSLATSTQLVNTSKFRRIAFDKKAAPAEMSKLLSFGYAEHNKPVQ